MFIASSRCCRCILHREDEFCFT